MNRAAVAVILLAAAAASARADQDLAWPADKLNLGWVDVEKAAQRAGDHSVGLRVYVVKGAAATADRLSVQLLAANAIFNGLELRTVAGGAPQADPKSAACGVRFRFEAPARELELPAEYADLADADRDVVKGEAFYGSISRLSGGELALAAKLGLAAPGEINVVYLPGLGGGRGYTYLPNLLRAAAEKTDAALLKGRTVDDVVNVLKNTILIADTGTPFTLAHELGHALTGRGHERRCEPEDVKADPEGCKTQDDNLMLPDGRYGLLLNQEQCRKIGRGLRRGQLDRLPAKAPEMLK